jgi:hypothetical protein
MADLLKSQFGIAKTDTPYEITVGGSKAWTILSISICNTEADDDGTFDLYVDTDGSGTDAYIYKAQALPGGATFIHNDKIVLAAGLKLGFVATASQDIDVVVTYLEQDV